MKRKIFERLAEASLVVPKMSVLLAQIPSSQPSIHWIDLNSFSTCWCFVLYTACWCWPRKRCLACREKQYHLHKYAMKTNNRIISEVTKAMFSWLTLPYPTPTFQTSPALSQVPPLKACPAAAAANAAASNSSALLPSISRWRHHRSPRKAAVFNAPPNVATPGVCFAKTCAPCFLAKITFYV